MEYTDICFAPVLSMNEAYKHPHNDARGTFIEIEGMLQPGPAPRFSRTAPKVARPSPIPGEHSDDVLADYGFSGDEISALKATEAVAPPTESERR